MDMIENVRNIWDLIDKIHLFWHLVFAYWKEEILLLYAVEFSSPVKHLEI